MGNLLYSYQVDAVKRLKNGNILVGGVGSGKSRTSLAYYYIRNGGKLQQINGIDSPMKNPKDLYIITTARKRDSDEWAGDMLPFVLSPHSQTLYSNKVVVDSWNNIGKYKDVKDAFFIFDEQRVIGYGAWSKSFIKISKSNEWILLSATPGDTWSDYISVFIANGFYKNKTEFISEHVIYKRVHTFYKVDRYVNTKKLQKYRDDILVNMEFKRKTKSHHETILCEYDRVIYQTVMVDRWNPYESKPLQNASDYCQMLRKVVNSDPDRLHQMMAILKEKKKAIIFYNYNYELEAIRAELDIYGWKYAEWNGQKHQEVPVGNQWAYLVQYTAGAEAWNCITTDTMIFYSQNYSYRIMLQSAGRIDRLNTPYTDLYYYHFKSIASIDTAITKALRSKRKFNEDAFAPFFKKQEERKKFNENKNNNIYDKT